MLLDQYPLTSDLFLFQAVKGGLSSEAKVEVFTLLRRSVPKTQNDTLKRWEAKVRWGSRKFTRFLQWMVGIGNLFFKGKKIQQKTTFIKQVIQTGDFVGRFWEICARMRCCNSWWSSTKKKNSTIVRLGSFVSFRSLAFSVQDHDYHHESMKTRRLSNHFPNPEKMTLKRDKDWKLKRFFPSSFIHISNIPPVVFVEVISLLELLLQQPGWAAVRWRNLINPWSSGNGYLLHAAFLSRSSTRYL